jgi:hypothetical protein
MSAVTESQIKSAEKEARALFAKVWRTPPFTHARQDLELKLEAARIRIRKLKADFNYQKRRQSAGGSTETKTDVAAAAKASGVSESQMNELIAAIRGLVDNGTPEHVAAAQVLARVHPRIRRRFPLHLISRFTVPRFRPVPGTVARPARSIDPVVIQQGINPRGRGRSIDPIVPGRSIDPIPPGIVVPTASGAFNFPPAPAAMVDQAIEQQDIELAAAAAPAEPVPWYMDHRAWVVAGVVAAAAYVGGKSKKAKPV